MEIHERIRIIRKDNNLSQTAFGEKLGASRDVISNIENGRVYPSKIILNLICSTFGINKEWLEEEKGEMLSLNNSDDSLAEALALISITNNEKIKSIVEKIIKLDDRYIESLDVLIDGLINK